MNSYTIAHVDDKNILGISSYKKDDENNYYISNFDGENYHQKWCENGVVKTRIISKQDYGSEMGLSLKLISNRMQNDKNSELITQEKLNEFKKMWKLL